MDLRWYGDDNNRMRALARELVGSQPDIILATSTPTTIALQRETRTIPIVFAGIGDPVASGNRPAGVPEATGRPAGLDLRLPRRQYQRSCAMHPVVTVTGGSEEGSGATPRRPPPHWLAGQNRTKSRSMGQYECAAPSRSVDAPRGTRVN